MDDIVMRTILVTLIFSSTTPIELHNFLQYGKRYVGSLLSELRMIGPELCVKECERRRTECSSINYQKAALVCQMNALKPARNSVDINFKFEEDPGYFFINISSIPNSEEDNNPCKEVSCGEGQICSPLKKGTAQCSMVLIGDCSDVYHESTSDGVYRIYRNSVSYDVLCKTVINDDPYRGWTLVQKRKDPWSMNVNRTWIDYKDGFGSLHGELWMGNEFLHHLTLNRPMRLYLKLQAQNGSWYKATYEGFYVGSETDNFRLYFNETSYDGRAGDALNYSSNKSASGMQFTTYDSDNDMSDDLNCAAWLGGGWWFNDCSVSALNMNQSQQDGDNRMWNNIDAFSSVMTYMRPN